MEQKVLFTASTWSHISNFHRPYLAEFRRQGWRVDVACGGAEMEIPEASRQIQVPFEKSMASPKNLAAMRMLRREIRREGYTLISTHTALAAFFTRMAVKGLSQRPAVVNVAHGYLFHEQSSAPKRAILLGAERLAASVTDVLLTMNDWDYRAATEHALGREIRAIPGMGVDFDRHSPLRPEAREQLRREWGFGADDFLLVYAAEFSSRKNQAMLLRALARLPERVGLLLPGDGALREACIALAKQLDLERRVAFPGQVRDMGPWYAAADGAASASVSEGLPFHIMESMHAGLPVVASAVKGHTDLVADGKTGLLFPFGDESACAEQIGRLYAHPDLAAQLGAAAADRAEIYRLSTVFPMVMGAYSQAAPSLQSPKIEVHT